MFPLILKLSQTSGKTIKLSGLKSSILQIYRQSLIIRTNKLIIDKSLSDLVTFTLLPIII